MPLTLERDGLFLGRRDSVTAWYIVDPAVDGGVESAIHAWRAHVAATNQSRARRIVRVAVFLIVWLAVVGLGVLLAFVVIPGIDPWRGFIVVGAALLGAPAAGRVMAVVFPPSTVPPWGNPAVVPIPFEIEEWADDERPVDQLWRLVRAWRQLDEVTILLDLVDESWWEDTGQRRPDEAIETILEPMLREQWALRRDRLIEAAAAVGFVPPAEMLAELPPFSKRRGR